MRLESTAFVLRTYPLREADRIVVLFSRAEGVLRGVAPRAAASRKRFGGTLSVLNEVEFAYHEKEGRELGRLEWCRLLQPTPGEGRLLDAFYAASYMAEVLEQMGREREADERLYRLTRACSAALHGGRDAGWLARYFEVWALRLGGLLPEVEVCSGCGTALVRSGAHLVPGEEARCGTCSPGPASATVLTPQAVALLQRMLRAAPGEAPAAGTSTAALAAVARMAADLFLTVTERPFRTALLTTSTAKTGKMASTGRKT